MWAVFAVSPYIIAFMRHPSSSSLTMLMFTVYVNVWCVRYSTSSVTVIANQSNNNRRKIHTNVHA